MSYACTTTSCPGGDDCEDGCDEACNSTHCELSDCSDSENHCDSPEWCCEDPQCLEPIYERGGPSGHLSRSPTRSPPSLTEPCSCPSPPSEDLPRSLGHLTHQLDRNTLDFQFDDLQAIDKGDMHGLEEYDTDEEAIPGIFHKCRWVVDASGSKPGKTCGQSFGRLYDLHDHCRKHHMSQLKGRNSYSCGWDGCRRLFGKPFAQKGKLDRHTMTHTGYKPLKCLMFDHIKDCNCTLRFVAKQQLDQHQRTHSGEKPYVCKWPGCDKSFSQSSALTMHKRTHTGDKPLECDICHKRFSESSNLCKHRKTHTLGDGVRCPICQRSFRRSDQMRRHMSSLHSSEGDRRRTRRRSRQTLQTSLESLNLGEPQPDSTMIGDEHTGDLISGADGSDSNLSSAPMAETPSTISPAMITTPEDPYHSPVGGATDHSPTTPPALFNSHFQMERSMFPTPEQLPYFYNNGYPSSMNHPSIPYHLDQNAQQFNNGTYQQYQQNLPAPQTPSGGNDPYSFASHSLYGFNDMNGNYVPTFGLQSYNALDATPNESIHVGEMQQDATNVDPILEPGRPSTINYSFAVTHNNASTMMSPTQNDFSPMFGGHRSGPSNGYAAPRPNLPAAFATPRAQARNGRGMPRADNANPFQSTYAAPSGAFGGPRSVSQDTATSLVAPRIYPQVPGADGSHKAAHHEFLSKFSGRKKQKEYAEGMSKWGFEDPDQVNLLKGKGQVEVHDNEEEDDEDEELENGDDMDES